jgi:hypothetical protein
MAGRDWSNYDTAQAKQLAYLYDALGLGRLDQVCERLGIAAAPKDYAVDSTSYQNENRSVPLVEDASPEESHTNVMNQDPTDAQEPKTDESTQNDGSNDPEQLSLFDNLEGKDSK